MTTQTSLNCVAVITMECNKQKIEVLITEDKRAMVKEIVVPCGIRHSAVQKMIKTLGYQKVCCDVGSLTADG
jgi:hypothetical protein